MKQGGGWIRRGQHITQEQCVEPCHRMTAPSEDNPKSGQALQTATEPPAFRRRSSVSMKLGLAFITCSLLSIAFALEVSYELSGRATTTTAMALIVVMHVLLAIFLSMRLGSSLHRTAEMVERVASGDLEHPIAVTSNDEIGLVQASAESMRLKLLEQIRTLDDRLEEGIREFRFQKRALDHHVMLSVTDGEGMISEVNDNFCAVTGYTRDELINQPYTIIQSGHHPEEFFEAIGEVVTSGKVWRGEICIKTKAGDLYWLDSSVVPSIDADGRLSRCASISTNITETKLAQERLSTAVHGSRDGLWDWNLVTDEVYYGSQFCSMLGLRKSELRPIPEDWIKLILNEDLGLFQAKLEAHINGSDSVFECEIRMMHTDGETRWMLCRGAAIRDAEGRAIRIAGSLAEITEMKKAQRALKIAAEHDRLTSLPNKELFQKHIERALELCNGDDRRRFAVLFFDFDRFKVVNDSLGHTTGDDLLISIAGRFESELRPYDIAARFGGDEFVVLLNNIRSNEEANEIANRLLDAFAQPHEINGHSIRSTASIGLVSSDMGYSGAEEIIRDADAAMYQAKAAGRSRVVNFDAEMHNQAVDRITLEEDLEFAIERNELRLHYQPIVNLESGELEGFEALVRWQHPTRGLVPPDSFIGIAEDNGFIIPMGDWVFRTASRQIKQWHEQLRCVKPLFMNVNISKRQLTHPDCVGSLQRAINEIGIDPSILKIEITESTIVDNRSDIISKLEEIRSLGVRLAMDDFGTGQSSLSGLHRFPIDILKIDRSFIASMEESTELAAVVHSIVTLAQNLGMDIVAEGIETEDQVAILQAQEVGFGQGYLFSKPLTPEDAEAFIEGQFAGRRAA